MPAGRLRRGCARGCPTLVSPFFGEAGWEGYLNIFLITERRPPCRSRNRNDEGGAPAVSLFFLFRDTGCREKALSKNYSCKATSWAECLAVWVLRAWLPALPWALPVWLRQASAPAPAHLTARCKAQPPAG